MRVLDLTEMENIEGGRQSPGPGAVPDVIMGTCLVVGVAASVATGFITFGTSLFWGTSLTAAFCAGAAVGAKIAKK